MKSTPLHLSGEGAPPTRLTDLLVGKSASGLSPLEEQAASLLSKVPTPTSLSPKSLERIGEAIAKPPASPSGWLIGGGMGLAVVVAAATVLLPRQSGRQSIREPVVTIQPLAPVIRPIELLVPVPSTSTAQLPTDSDQPPLPMEPPRSSSHPLRKHGGAVASRTASIEPVQPSVQVPLHSPDSPMVQMPAEESALAIESRLLGLALRELRQTHDAKQALVRLDEYAARFPSGLLTEEAQAARVDALLVLGRRAEALGLLEQTTFTRLPRGGELTVLRGELRAASGRCRDALSDFAASGGVSSTAEVTERGLYGQGMCRAHLGDLAGAESDLRAYLARFPAGRFRASAQATLRNLTATP